MAESAAVRGSCAGQLLTRHIRVWQWVAAGAVLVLADVLAARFVLHGGTVAVPSPWGHGWYLGASGERPVAGSSGLRSDASMGDTDVCLVAPPPLTYWIQPGAEKENYVQTSWPLFGELSSACERGPQAAASARTPDIQEAAAVGCRLRPITMTARLCLAVTMAVSACLIVVVRQVSLQQFVQPGCGRGVCHPRRSRRGRVGH
jgi:hypothetical protein